MSCSDDNDPGLELFDNVELETGFGKPIGWTSFINSTDLASEFDLQWTTDDAVSGEKSLWIYIDSENPDEFASWTRTLLFDTEKQAGTELELSVWIKGDMEGEGARVLIRGDIDGEQVSLSSTSVNEKSLTGDFDWKKIKLSTTIVDGVDSYSVFLVLLGSTTGEVYFDNVSLELK